jgi:hypothetical protein
MLQPGDLVPHFEVTNLQGETVSYSTMWQRRNLVLVTVPASDPDGTFATYVSRLTAEMPASAWADTTCVITRDTVLGLPSPGVVVADRWGEIVHVARGSHVGELPRPLEIGEWVDYVQRQCPECEGEAK